MIRLSPEQRKTLIISTAVELANRDGLLAVTHASVAEAADISMAVRTVRKFFLRDELLQAVAKDARACDAVRTTAKLIGLQTVAVG